MTGNTPLYGWPYPTGVDRLDAAVTSIPQSLATAIENTLASLYAGGVPGAGWVNFPWAANWASVSGQGRYTKYGSRVWVDAYGLRSTSSFASGGVIGTLPVGYRPSQVAVRPCMANNGGTLTPALAQVNTDGTITVAPSGLAAIPAGAAALLTFDFPTN